MTRASLNSNEQKFELFSRFVCNQISGLLCNNEGAVIRQWKWDELDNDDLNKMTKDLCVNVRNYSYVLTLAPKVNCQSS